MSEAFDVSTSCDALPLEPVVVPASFDLLYESDDARFALFEVYDGHLVSVDTSKLV